MSNSYSIVQTTIYETLSLFYIYQVGEQAGTNQQRTVVTVTNWSKFPSRDHIK